jgi:hypothetical protein
MIAVVLQAIGADRGQLVLSGCTRRWRLKEFPRQNSSGNQYVARLRDETVPTLVTKASSDMRYLLAVGCHLHYQTAQGSRPPLEHSCPHSCTQAEFGAAEIARARDCCELERELGKKPRNLGKKPNWLQRGRVD